MGSILFGRSLVRFIGLNVRYLFFKLTKKKVSYKDLTTPVINRENDYDEKGMQQDIYNALAGAFTLVLLAFLASKILG